MTTFFTNMRASFRRGYAWAFAHKVWSGIIIVVLLGGGYAVYAHEKGSSAGTQYVLAAVTEGTLTSTVSGSGQVAANQTLELSPKSSGEVTYVGVKAGDQVTAGTVIARVDDTSAEESLRDAEASLTSAKISYQQSITSSDTDKTKAEADAFSSASTAVTDISSTLKELNTTLFSISDLPSHSDQQGVDAFAAIIGGTDGDSERATIKADYSEAQDSYQAALAAQTGVSPTSSDTDIDAYAAAAYKAATDAATAVSATHTIMTAVNDKLTHDDTTIPSAFTSALSTIASDDSQMSSDVSSVYAAKSTLDSSLATLGDSGSTPLDIQTAQLSLTKAQNAVDDAETNLANYVVTAPFDGTIAKVDVQVHDQASGAVATLVTSGEYADLSLNEVDAAKVQDGQKAVLTFDAVDGLTINGTVSELDTVGTVSNGVVTYDAKIAFDDQDARVKPGMTVDAVITTSSVDNALMVPSSAVTTVGNQSYVQIVSTGAPTMGSSTRSFGGRTASTSSSTRAFNTSSTTPTRSFGGTGAIQTVEASTVTVTRVPVVVGISNDTETQIVSGLKLGQYVVTSTKTGTSATTATTGTTRTTTGGFGGATGGARPAGGFGGGAAAARAL